MLTSSTTIATQLACALQIQSAQPDWERVKDILAQLESTGVSCFYPPANTPGKTPTDC